MSSMNVKYWQMHDVYEESRDYNAKVLLRNFIADLLNGSTRPKPEQWDQQWFNYVKDWQTRENAGC